MHLCVSCSRYLALNIRRAYSTAERATNKWAKPPPSKWARPENLNPRPAPRTGNWYPQSQYAQSQRPSLSSGSSWSTRERPYVGQRQNYPPRENYPPRGAPQHGPSLTNAPRPEQNTAQQPTRFPMQDSDANAAAERSRWALKKAQDRARLERKIQRSQVVESGEKTPKRRPRSAHLQAVRSQLYIPQSISVSNFSKLLNVRLEVLQRKMADSGFDENGHDYVLSSDVATLLAEEFNFQVIVDETSAFDLYPQPVPADTSALPPRPPFVTLMGHVDHGKTTLLDTLRKSSVAAKEAGGITQHIGAFSVKLPGGKQITFLDTPGHAAFESMRQRGASVTDIVVLVVAADDSVMPQTTEAIKHAQKAGVNMIVAINKMDKPGVDVEKVKRDLMTHGVEVEDYGGETQSVPVSGLTGKGLDNLENAIVSLAEIMDIRADPTGVPEGWVIESSVKKGRGNVASMIVRRGVLKIGSIIVAGRTWCRVRAMTNEAGKTLKSAGPGTPVEVSGWAVLPIAGDEILGSSSEKEAKQVVANRILRAEQIQQLSDIEAINDKRLKDRGEALKATDNPTDEARNGDTTSIPDVIEVPFIVKGDVSGSVEAVTDSLTPIGNEDVRSKMVESGVGEVSESDVMRAAAVNGKVIAFNVPVDAKAKASAAREGVQIISHNIIYRLIDEVREILAGLLEPIRQQRVLGEAEILKLFSISIKGRENKSIAGCRITNGTINRAEKVRIMRKKDLLWEGKLAMLKHVKQEVQTLGKGNECGLEFEGFQDFQEGDTIQCFAIDEIKRTL